MPDTPETIDCAKVLDLARSFDLVERILEQVSVFDTFLAHINTHFARPTFIQVGANDGKYQDPLLKYINEGSWQGLLIEPNPEPFAALHQLHGHKARLRLLPVAIAAEEGSIDLHIHKSRSTISSTKPTVGPITKFQDGLRTISVPARRLDTLVREAGYDRVDVLQVDTEGADLDVMQTFDFTKFRPIVINYEDRHLWWTDRAKAERWLRDLGYIVCRERAPRDTVAVDEVALKALGIALPSGEP